MATATLVELLDAGVHFGHQTQKWNPKMKQYIFGAKNGIYIIDLRKTSDLLDAAYDAVRKVASMGRNVLFVGTKKQAVDVIAQEATRCGSYYINRRWLGGMMTNFETIRGRVNKLRELEAFLESGAANKLPKKEVAQLNRQQKKDRCETFAFHTYLFHLHFIQLYLFLLLLFYYIPFCFIGSYLEDSSDCQNLFVICLGYNDTCLGSGCMYNLSISNVECHMTGVTNQVTGLRIGKSVYCISLCTVCC